MPPVAKKYKLIIKKKKKKQHKILLLRKTKLNSLEVLISRVSTQGFWVLGQKAFSDVTIFNPLAKYYNAKKLKPIFPTHQKENKEASIRESLRHQMNSLLR